MLNPLLLKKNASGNVDWRQNTIDIECHLIKLRWPMWNL
jgi:hypothetical protein